MRKVEKKFAIVGTTYQYDDNNYSSGDLDHKPQQDILYTDKSEALEDCNVMNMKAKGMGDNEGVYAPFCVVEVDFYPKQTE